MSTPSPATATKARRPRRPRATKQQSIIKQLEAEAEREKYELHLLRDIKAVRLPLPERHAKWHPMIEYEADLLYRREFLIIEVDGGIHIPFGHHNFGAGYEYDRVRDAEALCLGFTVLRVTPGMVKDGTAIDYVERVLHAIRARGKRIEVSELPPAQPVQHTQPRPSRTRNKRTA